ncbi:hypothetical protein [Rathayibacter sp. PhB152]|uniref:hypothetical protein n=1 Tax=Rathayibacter sp. PhB152 TaxID=2485190 RepID=UPI0021A3A504|nr:hypothetical protein [Rathayibacter sp. PhB152]
MTWLDHVDDAHPSMRDLEQWLSSLTPWSRAHELGRVDDLLEAAAAGDLYDTGDERTPIKPIRRDPEVFELRHTSLSKKLRFYHGEPPELPSSLVALHRHIKSTAADQEAQIEHAAERYEGGRSSTWGAA